VARFDVAQCSTASDTPGASDASFSSRAAPGGTATSVSRKRIARNIAFTTQDGGRLSARGQSSPAPGLPCTAVAIGVPDERTGEAVKLVVVRKDPAVGESDVRGYCESHLAGYKRPRVVEFRAELPKTPVGKILRRELRDMS